MNQENKIILCDTRERKNKKILEYFEKNKIDYITSKLEYGDYKIFKDNTTVIDRKDSLLELSHNLCNMLEHERIKREISRAVEDGCKNFIFLIADSKIKTVQDIKKWSSPHTKVKGETLLKIMITMKKKYGIRFIICPRKNMGKMILKLLEKGE